MIYILHDLFLDFIEQLTAPIQKFHKDHCDWFDFITGIPRGGVIPAVYLSHILNIPILDWADFKRFNKPEWPTLIVEDIIDTGKTLNNIGSFRRPIDRTCSLIIKDSPKRPDFWAQQYPQDQWIVFPWETDESTKK